MAPILTLEDSSHQFVVEMDASDLGVGAVLSLKAPKDNGFHSCTFFTHHLSPAKQKYAIVERELLSVKLALEEWCHWLEDAEQPFIVWTDHRNLEYLQMAK
ncbi:hypothetical protein QTP70_009418 [Hemibagrus guttatus]|uniref:Reverse transcriptase RNase H-like domain-containing protein n=1 Tax=Hemibagrus guttatus TaxID=175788 RepID=A0AAE0Q994_9TELE|nr:hypothetical protein QTP70_009418 [Hemibagrus guttatus]